MAKLKLRECPDCGSDNVRIDEKNNQLICKDCGLIYEPLEKDLEEKFEKSHKMKK